ncbi:MAG: alanine--tRNA ligase [Candidatus Bathyarchaeota archaeon]|nr:alanine--tRNA ligase [Candidatus Bathyarchaeota archaeon]
MKFPVEEYALPFFKEKGYVRKLCPKCGTYYWTLNPDQETCGEARAEGCAHYMFIGNPPTNRSYTVREMREFFLSFFEKRGHTRIKPYPVVARWRNDIYLTHASIIDFQPYVTEGIAPPPANPLVISQPCIRLVDITNTGPTFGKYITIFEMGGHHAFNYPDKEVYWKDQTVRYHDDFIKELGIEPEEVTYKEEIWSGGGNAGPCLECIVSGLEVATLVFMQYKVVNGSFIKLPIRTVDTGYGIERYTWLSQGTPSAFQAIYGDILNKIFQMAGINYVDENFLAAVAKYSALISLDKTVGMLESRRKIAEKLGTDPYRLDEILSPIENAFAVADHTKCLTFILSEGVVPSNVQEGYLARLIFRKIYRLLRMLGISDRLYDIVDMQIAYWSTDYPHLKEMRDEIMEILSVESEKFKETITRGESLVRRMAGELKAKGVKNVPVETFAELYDSHGIPPEIVKEIAEAEGLKATVPENFYSLIAERHMTATQKPAEESTRLETWLKAQIEGIPETETLYYKDQYMREFEAKVLKVIDDEYVILDRTCFYPEGGGQPADTGYLLIDGEQVKVVDVQKVGKIIVHRIKKATVPKQGSIIRGVIDWDKRYALMKSHTATHIINSAARRVLGQHVWQFGTQKGVESSRLDITHYRRLTREEVQKIELLANEAVFRSIPVEILWMPRSEAESKYGFRLYQGGAVPGKEIRVVKIGDWEVEACGGTHVGNTGEIGFIKILYTERIQDGVERLVYAVGIQALKYIQENEQLLLKVAEIMNCPVEKLEKTAERIVKDLREAEAEKRKLIKELAERESTGLDMVQELKEIDGVKVMFRDFKSNLNVDLMIHTATRIIKNDEATITVFYGADEKTARIVVMAGKKALEKGANAVEIAKEASTVIGGGGGGRPDFAQGGGPAVDKLQEAIRKAEDVIRRQIERNV